MLHKPKELSFWREVFSDSGIGSFSNVATALLLVFAIGWVTYLVIRNGSIPDVTGLIGLIGILYGIKKITNSVSDFSAKK